MLCYSLRLYLADWLAASKALIVSSYFSRSPEQYFCLAKHRRPAAQMHNENQLKEQNTIFQILSLIPLSNSIMHQLYLLSGIITWFSRD